MNKEVKRAIDELKADIGLQPANMIEKIPKKDRKHYDKQTQNVLTLICFIEEFQPTLELLENYGKNGVGQYSERYLAEYQAIHHTQFYDFAPDPDEIYKKYYEQKEEIEKLKKENEELRVQGSIVYLDYKTLKDKIKELIVTLGQHKNDKIDVTITYKDAIDTAITALGELLEDK